MPFVADGRGIADASLRNADGADRQGAYVGGDDGDITHAYPRQY